jgi:hypothetical protein
MAEREKIEVNGFAIRHGAPNSLLKNSFFAGCSKMSRCKAPEILRSEVYLDVRRNDEG